MCQAIIDIKEDAKTEGITEGIKRVALNLVKSGKMSLEEISDVTGLTLNEINKIAKK